MRFDFLLLTLCPDRALANSSICDQGLVTLNLTSWRDINASEVQRIDNYCNGAINQSTASQESCDERNDCIVQAEYQGQQEFKTICACPYVHHVLYIASSPA